MVDTLESIGPIEDTVWGIGYALEVNAEGEREIYAGYECVVLATDNLEDALAKVRKEWKNQKIKIEFDDDKEFSFVVVGVRFMSAEVVCTLTDFEAERGM